MPFNGLTPPLQAGSSIASKLLKDETLLGEPPQVFGDPFIVRHDVSDLLCLVFVAGRFARQAVAFEVVT